MPGASLCFSLVLNERWLDNAPQLTHVAALAWQER